MRKYKQHHRSILETNLSVGQKIKKINCCNNRNKKYIRSGNNKRIYEKLSL